MLDRVLHTLLICEHPIPQTLLTIKQQNYHHIETSQLICRANQVTRWQLWRLKELMK